MYSVGVTEEDRRQADELFLTNMTICIDNGSQWKWLVRLRMDAATSYYCVVRTLGKGRFELVREGGDDNVERI